MYIFIKKTLIVVRDHSQMISHQEGGVGLIFCDTTTQGLGHMSATEGEKGGVIYECPLKNMQKSSNKRKSKNPCKILD